MLGFRSINYIVASSPAGKPLGENIRPLAKFPEKSSGTPFISYTLDKKASDGYSTEMEKVKQQVRIQIVDTKGNAAEKLNLIDMVERLGVSHHFEKEIQEQIQLISSESGSSAGDFDLGTAALQFRLFRQHGINMSSDIFDQFTNGNGQFRKSLTSDTRSLLSLYEAAHLRTHRDTILDEALMFTTNHLSSSSDSQSSYIDKQVQYALQRPIRMALPRYEARHFITMYEENELKNTSLLRLSKLEYNLSQLLHKQELSTALRWWKERDMPSKIDYGRDRLVEYYFFSLGMFFEPRYSNARILLTKFFAFSTFIDDTYDSYGTLEELEIFTAAIRRWDISELERLPEYMKIVYGALLKVHDELDQYAVQRPYAMNHLKEVWKDYAEKSMIQSNWFLNNKVPSFADYFSNGLRLSGVKLVAFYCSLVTGCPESMFKWLSHNPRILVAAETICRLQNDVSSHKFEKERGTTTPIDCYMKSYNVSEEEAKKKLMEMVEDAWKDFHEEYFSLKQAASVATDVLDPLLYQVRLMDFAYKNGQDGWTDTPKSVEPFIKQVLVEPIPL